MILKSKHLSCHYFWRHDVSGKRGVLWQKWEWGLNLCKIAVNIRGINSYAGYLSVGK